MHPTINSYIHRIICQTIWLFIQPTIYTTIHQTVLPSSNQAIHHLFMYPTSNLSSNLSNHPSLKPTIFSSNYQSSYLSVHSPIDLSSHLCIQSATYPSYRSAIYTTIHQACYRYNPPSAVLPTIHRAIFPSLNNLSVFSSNYRTVYPSIPSVSHPFIKLSVNPTSHLQAICFIRSTTYLSSQPYFHPTAQTLRHPLFILPTRKLSCQLFI